MSLFFIIAMSAFYIIAMSVFYIIAMSGFYIIAMSVFFIIAMSAFYIIAACVFYIIAMSCLLYYSYESYILTLHKVYGGYAFNFLNLYRELLLYQFLQSLTCRASSSKMRSISVSNTFNVLAQVDERLIY